MYPRRFLLLALLVLDACSHGRVSFGGNVTWGKTAEEDYEEGVQQMKSGHADDAQKFFEHVRTKYPFSSYVPLAELRVADIKRRQGRYSEAADTYQQFLKLHPNHEQADYAAFQCGAVRWEDGPNSFFLFPPPYEKDLAPVRDAAKALDDFLKKYPNSKYKPDAEKMLAKAQELLLHHEWYVVGFYEKRNRWAGVAARLEGMVKDYPGAPREAEALYRLAEAYLKLDERFRAQQTLQELIVKHPSDPQRGAAEKLLASLR